MSNNHTSDEIMSECVAVIAIDGPSASGKGTIASAVAAELGWHYLDSGAIYRVAALFAQQRHMQWDNAAALAELFAELPIRFEQDQVWLENKNVTQAIRSEEIGMGASIIARWPEVRKALLRRQQLFLQTPGLVADGRDMGSVVFPKAKLKVFLMASEEVRATRRALQLGIPIPGVQFDAILENIKKRDEADRNRAAAPLQPADHAKILDTSTLTVRESVQKVLDWYHGI